MAIRGMQSGYFMRDGTSAEGEEKYFNKNFLLSQIVEEMLSRAPQIRCWANSVKPRLPLLIISLSSHNRAARLILKMHFSFSQLLHDISFYRDIFRYVSTGQISREFIMLRFRDVFL